MSRSFKYSSTYYRHLKKGRVETSNPDETFSYQEDEFEHYDEEEPPLTSSDESDEEVEIDVKNQFQKEIRKWAVDEKIPQKSMKLLLHILRNSGGHKSLPKDPRTLLETPKNVEVTPMGQGEFWYNSLYACFNSCFPALQQTEMVTIQFHVDGLPISRSSKIQLWPILFRIVEKPWIPPQVVAIYSGLGKPGNLADYLSPIVTELQDILLNGVIINSHKIHVQIHSFVADSPARSYIKGVVYFNHHSGCTKCETEGEFFTEAGKHMSFYHLDAAQRTDEGFRAKIDEDHHKETSPLELLPVDMVRQFPVADRLHLIDLGVMRKLLQGWVYGNFNFKTKWCARDVESISSLLRDSNSNMPVEIHRKIRGLDQLSYWKGTEFATFMHYPGITILRDFLDKDAYEHFLLLFCAITIYSTKHYEKYYPIAEKMVRDFIEMYMKIYGIDAIGSNVHNLIHVIEDVRLFGPLSCISSYPFESYLCQLKRLVRTGKRPLTQVAKRVIEMSYYQIQQEQPSNVTQLKHKISNTHSSPNCDSTFTTVQVGSKYTLKSNEGNKWFLTQNDEIAEMINGTRFNQEIGIFGQEICGVRRDFFEFPIKSSTLHIYEMPSIFRGEEKLYKVCDVKCKMIRLRYRDTNVFVPLIHTLK